MKELLEVIIKGLVDQKDKVFIEERNTNDIIIFSVKVAKDDMGRIIGKQGSMARSIRMVMKAVAIQEHKKINIEFID